MKRLFVVQDHFSRRRHYDLRFEIEGGMDEYVEMRQEETSEPLEKTEKVLMSFAVPKHRFPNVGERLLAIKTENHPWSYRLFAGWIPEGSYGAGEVKLLHSDYIEIDKIDEKEIVFTYEDVKYRIKSASYMGEGKFLLTRVST